MCEAYNAFDAQLVYMLKFCANRTEQPETYDTGTATRTPQEPPTGPHNRTDFPRYNSVSHETDRDNYAVREAQQEQQQQLEQQLQELERQTQSLERQTQQMLAATSTSVLGQEQEQQVQAAFVWMFIFLFLIVGLVSGGLVFFGVMVFFCIVAAAARSNS